jgi:hypothetical protein
MTAPLTITVMRSATRNTGVHVVLHQQDGVVGLAASAASQHAVGLLGAHAGQRLVEQQHLRRRWPGTWRSPAAASGRGDRQPGGAVQPARASPALAAAARAAAVTLWLAAAGALPPSAQGRVACGPALPGGSSRSTLKVGIDGVALVAAAQARLGAARLRPSGDVLAQQLHVSFGRRDLTGQDVDQRGLARAVGADHGVHLRRAAGRCETLFTATRPPSGG